MPYIKGKARYEIDEDGRAPETAGELNYVITQLIIDYAYEPVGNVNYQRINDIVGVLECAKMEMYRRLAAPYEDRKCHENGDVYPNV